ncbi:Fic family protein [Candidatus Pacearchaeota archaeon]|nr:Fic family protein [Candidatus Pacearchaeota archaeon]
MVVSQELADEIEAKRYKITGNPDYFLKRSRMLERHLRRICDIYSFWIEHPDLRGELLRQHHLYEGEQLKEAVVYGLNGIRNAWKYLSQATSGQNFISVIDSDLIIETGRKVCPLENEKGFREDKKTLNFPDYTPPNPAKVQELVAKFCDDLKRSDLWPVETAVLTHLTIAGIQPFREGNKRTARLLQDRILNDYGLPPAVIPAGERRVYFALLDKGLVGLKNNDLSAQRPFFDYIAGKVNSALDEILDDLNPYKNGKKNRKH